MRIHLEQYHIQCGIRLAAGACPVAIAITPRLPAFWRAEVYGDPLKGYDLMIITDYGAERAVALPSEVHTWINQFDRGEVVQPIDFGIAVPPG